jgi:hypothetical protein
VLSLSKYLYSTGWAYTYDANGNMVTRTGDGKNHTFAYNGENQMVSVSGSASASFVYDGVRTTFARANG